MPKIFTECQKIKIVQYGSEGVEDFSFSKAANDLFEALKKIIKK